MKPENPSLDPKESLEIIQKMVYATRQNYADKGIYMIIWGIALILASCSNYLIVISTDDPTALSHWTIANWIGFPVLAGILSSVIGYRKSHSPGVQTHIGSLLNRMWIGYTIVLFVTMYFCVQAQLSPIPFILLLTGFATFIFGLGVRSNAFIIGSICFVLFSLAAFLSASQPETANYQLLIFACAILIGYLIPGILLYKKVYFSKA